MPAYLGKFFHLQQPELQEVGVVLGIPELGSNLWLVVAQLSNLVLQGLKLKKNVVGKVAECREALLINSDRYLLKLKDVLRS